MAFKIGDRVRELSTTTGTGSLTLSGAALGYQTFDTVLDTGDTTWYALQIGANWEVGLGTFTAPATLARTTILASSNAGSVVSLPAGDKDVFITTPADALRRLKDVTDAGHNLMKGADPAAQRTTLQVNAFNRPRQLLINPSMRHSIRRGTTAVDCTTGITVTVDQVRAVLSSSPGGTLRAQQVAGATPNGSGSYIRFSVQATDSSLAAGDYYGADFPIEGRNVADTLMGSASAKQVLKFFWVRSSIAGTFGVALQNGGLARSYVQTITIAGGEINTWVLRSLFVPGCTDGTWPTSEALGMRAIITFASGTTFQATAGAWQSSDVRTTSAQTNFMATGSATFDITETALHIDRDVTSIVPAWEMPDFDKERYGTLAYYHKTDANIGFEGVAVPGQIITYIQPYQFPAPMRVAPSFSLSSFVDLGNMNASSATGLSRYYASLRGSTFSGVGSVTKAAGYFVDGIIFDASF